MRRSITMLVQGLTVVVAGGMFVVVFLSPDFLLTPVLLLTLGIIAVANLVALGG